MEFNKLIISESLIKPGTMFAASLIGLFKKFVLKRRNWRPVF